MEFIENNVFDHAIKNMKLIKQHLGRIDSILEIGSFEGRSAVWMLKKMLSESGKITCIDPFLLHHTLYENQHSSENPLEKAFRNNVEEARAPTQEVEIFPKRSFEILPRLLAEGRQYDFIYCDGDHSSPSVLQDAVLSYGLLKKGGILLFDDYLYNVPTDHLDRSKMAIDAFSNIFARRIKVLIDSYQFAIQKIQ